MDPATSSLVRRLFLNFERGLGFPSEAARAASAHVDAVRAVLESGLGLEYLAVSGSYGHGTEVYGSSDLDLIAQLPHHRAGVDSARCLEQVRALLRTRFPDAEVSVDAPAVVLRFPDSPGIPIDVIPARRAVAPQGGLRYHEIPHGRGQWKMIFVDNHKRYVAIADELLGYEVKKVIRVLKAWNHLHRHGLSSVYLELFVAQYYHTGAGIPPVVARTPGARVFRIGEDSEPDLTEVDFAADVWANVGNLVRTGLSDLRDPTGQVGTVAALRGDGADKGRTLNTMAMHFDLADSALRFENAGNLQQAMMGWNLFFAGKFLNSDGTPAASTVDYGPEVAALQAELVTLWRRTGRYLVDDAGPDRRAVEIGRRLDAKGGWSLLYATAERVRAEADDDAVIELSWAWNGIGSWQA
jgi:hypothetical protein